MGRSPIAEEAAVKFIRQAFFAISLGSMVAAVLRRRTKVVVAPQTRWVARGHPTAVIAMNNPAQPQIGIVGTGVTSSRAASVLHTLGHTPVSKAGLGIITLRLRCRHPCSWCTA